MLLSTAWIQKANIWGSGWRHVDTEGVFHAGASSAALEDTSCRHALPRRNRSDATLLPRAQP